MVLVAKRKHSQCFRDFLVKLSQKFSLFVQFVTIMLIFIKFQNYNF